ncbi:BQ5605_C074g12907 [Microbotryum silenes-dioicae]|uniref:BQ5605_C011g06678 protein n=1 Tax=Microbotryum silenes-dioicae TaxID=796604 RepID=A0A2X0N839_9BASI|nr:BQ5605_C011g06678 [Microbotryum silenes-dioicae]SGY89270.1 BQ5605_C131g13370 [Microbotryum silenes-dioicae]SGZ31498.1 BQ5605_C045g12184 [Microbotryum silenes-dioicae]SGZ32044.1 BQ5605_C043g12059 [Microbotryum silenes-dioicae]SGZ34943.1 BQ5605_C074g12907 [Microbotryum silenes-dioicae]
MGRIVYIVTPALGAQQQHEVGGAIDSPILLLFLPFSSLHWGGTTKHE